MAAATGCAIFRFDCRPLILHDSPLGHHLCLLTNELLSKGQRSPACSLIENKTWRTAIVTLALIGLNVFTWLLVQGAGAALPLARSVCDLGL